MAAEAWFDTRTGDILIGQAAAADRIDEAGPVIRPFRDVLLDEPFQYGPHDFDKADTQGLDRDGLIRAAQWLINVVNSADTEPDQDISKELIRHAHWLGAGASYWMYCEYRLGIANLSQEIQQPVDYSPLDRFDGWTTQDFVRHASQVAATTPGRRPRAGDYKAYSKAHVGAPTLDNIQARGLNISDLNEHNGFPNVRQWEEEDYIRYGAKVVMINGEDMFKRDTIVVLAAKDRGPSYATTISRFDNWENYKAKVMEHVATTRADTARKVSDYHHMIEDGQLPVAYAVLDEGSLLKTAGSHLLINSWQRSRLWDETRKQRMASVGGSKHYIVALRMSNPLLTAPAIELEADRLGILDDIWPPEDPSVYLKVTAKEVADFRAKERERLATFRQNRRAA
jgi:hypothetical protein